jgi:hypothetical protein
MAGRLRETGDTAVKAIEDTSNNNGYGSGLKSSLDAGNDSEEAPEQAG